MARKKTAKKVKRCRHSWERREDSDFDSLHYICRKCGKVKF